MMFSPIDFLFQLCYSAITFKFEKDLMLLYINYKICWIFNFFVM